MSSIVRVSEAASLALHTVVVLANDTERPLATGEIAGMFGLSEGHLSKVLQRLAKVGIVRSISGRGGGFVIGKSPDAITLLDVYEAIDGPLNDSPCLFASPVCDGKNCILGDLLKNVNESVVRYFSQTRLTDLKTVYEKLRWRMQLHAQENR